MLFLAIPHGASVVAGPTSFHSVLLEVDSTGLVIILCNSRAGQDYNGPEPLTRYEGNQDWTVPIPWLTGGRPVSQYSGN